MINRLERAHILVMDIETRPEIAEYISLDATTQRLWEVKTKYQRKEEFTPEAFYDRAGIWAEF